MATQLIQQSTVLDRYELFLERLDDPTTEPIAVFEPLKPFQLDELRLIREVSQDLQKKKDELILKQEEGNTEETTQKEQTEEKK